MFVFDVCCLLAAPLVLRFLLAWIEGNFSILSGSRESSSIFCLKLGIDSWSNGEGEEEEEEEETVEDVARETLSELFPFPLLYCDIVRPD